MTAGAAEKLEAEWLALQANHEQYERAALGVKLLAVALCALAFGLRWLWVLMLILWVQEAIFKTFQARLGARLLRVEALLREGQAGPDQALQLHSEWLVSRPRGAALLGEYALSALRPTVAFPYPLLALLVGFF
ncbi:hypothetical protein [Roseateles oligotrophus]|uniref:ABC transmembrane type-1 domain-containing protein n=1 Tax=Roseateles oligotrophus TaxID=1769250 RepID=A0ABT2YDD7_9BURK|nr:hypothetical protein [Roseateles oligotrophus]MCV2368044.1 hypothetical protein [Roseateles oligotrophus]